MGVRRAGRRRAGDPWRSVNSTKGAPSAHQTYSYGSPKMTLECEKLSEEELKELSGEVVTYKLEELEENKMERKDFMDDHFSDWTDEEKMYFAKYKLEQMKVRESEPNGVILVSQDHIKIHQWLIEQALKNIKE